MTSDLVEFPQGGEFPGVIGRTVEESSPAWPAPVRARDGAPNVLFVVLDDVGYGQLSCFGGMVETPNIDRVAASGPALREHAHDRAVLAHAREHPHRPQPPLQRRGLHHGAGHRLPRLRRADAVRERHAARDAAAAGLQHVLPRQVAPVARGGEHAGRAAAPLAARPRLRALLRLPRRRDQPVVSRPDARQRPDAAAEPPEDGYHLSEDLADQAIKYGPRRARQRAGEAVLHVLRARLRARAAPRLARSGPTATRATSTAAGTPTARPCSRASRRSVCCLRTRSSRRATPTCPSGRRCRRTSGGCTRG